MGYMTKPVILTGIRANSDLTIGNYFGAIKPTVDMAMQHSDEFQVNLFIPDLHSFTTPVDHSKLYEQILHNADVFVAAGLPLGDPSIHMYRQSFIAAHSELTWILDCFTGFGEMSRMTQFKDKSQSIKEQQVSMGLFNYPVLMAADILIYGSKYVPVGDDQTQHLEFARDIAERMNAKFGDLFVVPEPVAKQHEFFGKDQGLRIMDLANPTKKMSKSDDSGKGVIFLSDDPELAAKKVMSATTDDHANVSYDREHQPGIANLIDILALLRETTAEQVAGKLHGMNRYGDFKQIVARELAAFLTEFQARLSNVERAGVLETLEQSEEAMREQANQTLNRVQKAVGLRA